MHHHSIRAGCVSVTTGLLLTAAAASTLPPTFLRDRGDAIPTSLFGTYVGRGQLLVYSFAEYARNSAEEYHGAELGYSGETDYLGRSTEQEGLLFLAYGVTENLALELETTLYKRVTLNRAPEDGRSGMPDRMTETAFDGFEAQVRWRFARESRRSPEWFANLEIAPPHRRHAALISTRDWEFDLGIGAVKGFSWGTLTARTALSYEAETGELELGEYAIEYYRRVSESWRIVAAVEGESEDLSAIGELQWQFSPRAFAKFNLGIGLTKQAPDFAPEVGVLFHF